MARQGAKFAIDQGPSKLDLMLSLFDTDMGARTVRFQIGSTYTAMPGRETNRLDVQIISVRRRHPSAKIWEIEGIVETERGKERISIYYLSDTRKGMMWFEDKLLTHAVWETPDDTKKANAFLEVIFKMIYRYRESHPGNLDEEIFRLFEKAKRVHYAENSDSLDEAIEDI